MATLLILRKRIKTTKNISKTTKAFQMIAASRLKKAQEAATSSMAYNVKLDSLAKSLTNKIDKDNLDEYMKTPLGINKKLLIVISPDKGLCGGLITNLIRELLHYENNEKVFYITIGKKAENAVKSLNKEIIASFPFGTSLPEFETVYTLINLIDEYFLNHKVSEVKILSTRFINAFSQTPKFNNLLPVRLEQEVEKLNTEVIFEPSISQLLPDLLQHYLEMTIYQSLLESYASEQAARMIAMKNATDNALDMVLGLQLEYNKSRQEKITNELLDIGGGSQAAYE